MTAATFAEARDGGTANRHHQTLAEPAGVDGGRDTRLAMGAGAAIVANEAGFKARTSDVARDAGILLTYTFGTGPGVESPRPRTRQRVGSWAEGRQRRRGRLGQAPRGGEDPRVSQPTLSLSSTNLHLHL